MRTISRIITVTTSLMLISQAPAQNTTNYKTVFPAGIFIANGKDKQL